jgi:DNA-binding phage protein
MDSKASPYRNQVLEELDKVPAEYLPSLLKMVQAFREGVTLTSAEDTFREGWKEAMSAQTHPVTELWDETDA